MTERRKMRHHYVPGYRTLAVMRDRPSLCFDATPPNSRGPGNKVITFVEAPSVVLAEHCQDTMQLITMMVYNPEKPVGLVYVLTPESAREFGQQLLALAAKQEAAAGAEAAEKLAAIRAAGKGGAG